MKTKPSRFRMAMQSAVIATACLLVPWRGSGAEPIPPSNVAISPSANLPYAAGEVVRLYQCGIDKGVILNYIHTSTTPFQLSADDIIRLPDAGEYLRISPRPCSNATETWPKRKRRRHHRGRRCLLTPLPNNSRRKSRLRQRPRRRSQRIIRTL